MDHHGCFCSVGDYPILLDWIIYQKFRCQQYDWFLECDFALLALLNIFLGIVSASSVSCVFVGLRLIYFISFILLSIFIGVIFLLLLKSFLLVSTTFWVLLSFPRFFLIFIRRHIRCFSRSFFIFISSIFRAIPGILRCFSRSIY